MEEGELLLHQATVGVLSEAKYNVAAVVFAFDCNHSRHYGSQLEIAVR